MGLSWNSWYNPLDNIAATAKSIASSVPQFGSPVTTSTGTQLQVYPSTATSGPAPSPAPTTTGANTGQTGGSGTTTNTSTTGTTYNSGANSTPAIDPTQLAMYDQQIGNVNTALGRLDGQQNIGMQNVQSGFNDALNQLLQGKANSQDQYGKGTQQNIQSYVTNKNTIGSNAGNSLNSVLRLLGSRGAGGSSVAQFNAPQAVALQATQQRSGAGQTYGANQQGLDTNWNNYLTGFNQDQTKLNKQLTDNQNSLKSQIDSTRANLLQSLATLQGQRTAYAGGNPVDAAQPYLDQANQYLQQAQDLGLQAPTYQVQPTVYQAPSIQSYTASPFAAAQANNQDASTQSISPYLSLLLGQNKDKQNPLQTQASF